MSLAVHTSLLTAGPFSQHFHIQSFQLLIFICQKLMHSQAWRQPVKCRTIYNARSVHASAGLVLLLPCHLDEVSLQTHGRSLFLKAPTMHPVCSVETEKRPKCLRECKILQNIGFCFQPLFFFFCLLFHTSDFSCSLMYRLIHPFISKRHSEMVSVHCKLALHTFQTQQILWG